MVTEEEARKIGWYLVQGNFLGGADNRIDRWYWQLAGTDLDFRGFGFRTKTEALEALERGLQTAE